MKHFREILVAKTPEEAVRLRREAGPRALYLAGGTMAVPLAVRTVDLLVDISGLDLAGVSYRDGMVSIGAATRLCDLLAPEIRAHLPLVHEALGKCATPLIRNMATAGGGMAVVHLPSDLAVAVLASGGELEVIRGGAGGAGGAAAAGEAAGTAAGAGAEVAVTRLPAGELLGRGWLKGADLVCRIDVPKPRPGEGVSFRKFGRSAIDIAIVNAAVRIVRLANGKVAELCVAVGQTNSLPVVCTDLEAEAVGQKMTPRLIEHLAQSAGVTVKPRKDFRASAEYRQHLVRVMVARALAEAASKAGWRIES